MCRTFHRAPADRSQSDVNAIFQWLMHEEKLKTLLVSMTEHSAKKLCREMEFLHRNATEVLVHQGDKGETCFLILSGAVSIHIRTAEEQEMHAAYLKSGISADLDIYYGKKVAMLTAGATFGEVSLINANSKRNATVLVDANVERASFVALSSANYLRMTQSLIAKGAVAEQISFFERMFLFRKWTKMQLMQVVHSMKLMSISAGQYIVRKGAEPAYIYFILHGEALECARVRLNEDHSKVRKQKNWQRYRTVDLVWMGKYDVVGEHIVDKKSTANPTDIRALTRVECLALSRKLFHHHFGAEIQPHLQRTVKTLQIIARRRAMWRESRLQQTIRLPNINLEMTKKIMRLSGNLCAVCGKSTHVVSDDLCERKKIEKTEVEEVVVDEVEDETKPGNGLPKWRLAEVVTKARQISTTTAVSGSNLSKKREENDVMHSSRVGSRMVAEQWNKTGFTLPERPKSCPAKRLDRPITFGYASIESDAHQSMRRKLAFGV
ncbi:unnamed protein product [Albugo candida]|nr:unnamed protein product [Albugo candida]|eukprot:CCI49372.1 unnamed protein product [Albugo candida]